MRMLEEVGRFFAREPVGVLIVRGRLIGHGWSRSHPATYRQSRAARKRNMALVQPNRAGESRLCESCSRS
jgi:hypothetical protein